MAYNTLTPPALPHLPTSTVLLDNDHCSLHPLTIPPLLHRPAHLQITHILTHWLTSLTSCQTFGCCTAPMLSVAVTKHVSVWLHSTLNTDHGIPVVALEIQEGGFKDCVGANDFTITNALASCSTPVKLPDSSSQPLVWVRILKLNHGLVRFLYYHCYIPFPFLYSPPVIHPSCSPW